MVGFKNEPHKFLHQELWAHGFANCHCRAISGFPGGDGLSSNNVGGQSCITWHINLMSSWCEVQIMLLAAKHKFDFFSILAKHEVVFCSAELLWDSTRTMTPSTILQSSMGEYSILKRAPLEMLRPGHFACYCLKTNETKLWLLIVNGWLNQCRS